MAVDVFFEKDIRDHLLAGLVLSIRTAREGTADLAFIRGLLTMAQHQALGFGILWEGQIKENYKVVATGLLDEAKIALANSEFAEIVDLAIQGEQAILDISPFQDNRKALRR